MMVNLAMLSWNVLESKVCIWLYFNSDLQQIIWPLCALISSTIRWNNDMFSAVCAHVSVWGGYTVNEKSVWKEITTLGAKKTLVPIFLSTFQKEVDSFFEGREERMAY